MIKILDGQLEEIESIRWSGFVEQLVVSTRQQFPPHTEYLTDGQLYNAINDVAVRADAFGFKYDDEIEQVVDLAITFGASFDSDPCMAWVGHILNDESFAVPVEKLDFLDNDTRRYSLDIFDDDSVSVPVAAFQRFEVFLENQFSDEYSGGEPEALLKRIWPEKIAVSDPADLTTFVRSAIKLAHQYGFDEPWFQARFALIGFIVGHRFDIDPFLPGLKDALSVIGPDQHMRLDNLERMILSDVIVPRLRWALKNNGA